MLPSDLLKKICQARYPHASMGMNLIGSYFEDLFKLKILR